MESCSKKGLVYASAAYPSLILLSLLLLVNGFIKENYIWAQPLAESAALLFLPILLFTTITIIKAENTKRSGRIIITFAAVGFVNIGIMIFTGSKVGFSLIANGQLTDSACILLAAIIFLYQAVLLLIKRLSANRTGAIKAV